MENSIEILNDLIEINNDRIDGYITAVKETAEEDGDLRDMFTEMANQSRDHITALKAHLNNAGEEPATGTTVRGKIYRVWMDIKAAVTGHDRKSILASCVFGEEAAQKVYDSALEDASLTGLPRMLVMEQKGKLIAALDKITRLKDAQPA